MIRKRKALVLPSYLWFYYNMRLLNFSVPVRVVLKLLVKQTGFILCSALTDLHHPAEPVGDRLVEGLQVGSGQVLDGGVLVLPKFTELPVRQVLQARSRRQTAPLRWKLRHVRCPAGLAWGLFTAWRLTPEVLSSARKRGLLRGSDHLVKRVKFIN